MKISLGTAQLGLDYGVSNKIGQIKKYDARRILQYAYDKGIHMLDTAPSYGESEDIIGNFSRSDFSDANFDIVTKTPHFKGDVITESQVKKLLEGFELSRKKLDQEIMHGFLVHSCDNLFLPGGDKLFHAIEQLKKDGVVKKIGVSVYSSKQIDRLLDNFPIDLIQLPVNILDQRLLESGHLKKLKNHGIEIHARSVFLQGLLLMGFENVPPWFKPIQLALKCFSLEAEMRNISALQLALGFVQSINEVDKIIVGVNTLEQLRGIIKATSTHVNVNEFSNLSINDPTFLNPSNWKV